MSLVGWVARTLVAAWRRQEIEGRYRGADDFRGLHIDPADALASWRAATAPAVPWPAGLADDFAALRVLPELGLDDPERLVVVIAAAVELEPRLRQLVCALADDATTRTPTIGLVIELAGAAGLAAAEVRAACGADRRPTQYGLFRVVAVDGRPSRLDAVLVPSDWLVGQLSGAGEAPARLRMTRGRGACATDAPIAVRGADHVRHAEFLAAVAAVAHDADPSTVGGLARDARLAGATLVLALPERPPGELVECCETLARLGSGIAISTEAPVQWVPPPAWTCVDVPPLSQAERTDRWTAGLAGAGLPTGNAAALGRDYPLGAGAVDDAVLRAARSGDTRSAARASAWRDLTTVAQPGRVGGDWDDLVVTPAVFATLREIAAAISHRRIVLDDWSFGDRPGGRGYHILFAGPSGTGKTLAASVLAADVELELWVVDLARVVDKYLGETEKQLDRVLRAAEASGAMLLFDEAEALFGRRGEVREARDRWANVEVAYLLQRIEQHDGVTVLTTNVSHHIDGAFARRMNQRVDFPVPDAPLRRALWRRCIPTAALMNDLADLDVVADRFELAGGAIRNAAINAAYAAASHGGQITLRHLVRASVGELVKSGQAPTRADLGDLAVLSQR